MLLIGFLLQFSQQCVCICNFKFDSVGLSHIPASLFSIPRHFLQEWSGSGCGWWSRTTVWSDTPWCWGGYRPHVSCYVEWSAASCSPRDFNSSCLLNHETSPRQPLVSVNWVSQWLLVLFPFFFYLFFFLSLCLSFLLSLHESPTQVKEMKRWIFSWKNYWSYIMVTEFLMALSTTYRYQHLYHYLWR